MNFLDLWPDGLVFSVNFLDLWPDGLVFSMNFVEFPLLLVALGVPYVVEDDVSTQELRM